MFEVGFSEILLVGLVSLIVIGPQKLPYVARTAGLWLGKLRRMVSNVKTELQEELHAEEVRQLLAQHSAMLTQLQTEANRLPEIVEPGQVQPIPPVVQALHQQLPITPPMPPAPTPVESVAAPIKHHKAKKRRHGKR